MTFNLFLVVVCYPFLWIMYNFLKKEATPNGNIILGVTIPTEHLEDKSVTLACTFFLKNLKRIAMSLILVPVFIYFVPWFSVSYTLTVIWILLTIALPYLPYLKYHLYLKKVKYRNNWFSCKEVPTINDLKAIEIIRAPNSFLRFIIPVIVSFVPFVLQIFKGYGQRDYYSGLCCLIIIGLITPLFLLFNHILQKNRMEMVSTDRKLNRAFSHIQYHNWSSAFLQCAYINTIYVLFLWCFIRRFYVMHVVFIVGTMLYAFALICTMIMAEYKTRRLQQKIFTESGYTPEAEDDLHWIHGIVYLNKTDKRTVVPRRIGKGKALNLARPLGKILCALLIFLLVMIPTTCVGLFFEEFTPPSISLYEDSFTAEHLSTIFHVNYDEIEDVYLLEKTPSMKRLSGLEFDTIRKGDFQVENIGTCKLCLEPDVAYTVVIQTEDFTLLLNDYSNKDTKKLYNSLKKSFSKQNK